MDLSEHKETDSSVSDETSEESDVGWGYSLQEKINFQTRLNAWRNPSGFRWGLKKNFLKQLHRREIGGSARLPVTQILPRIEQVKLTDVLPNGAQDHGHVFLGISKCGRFLISYTVTTEEDSDMIALNTIYKYRLHWWSFSPPGKSHKVSEVMLFDNQNVYNLLYIAVCQWPADCNRILIYGRSYDNCPNPYIQTERGYLTITTVPSSDKCDGCLRVAASFGEEDLAASWDTCVRFSCFKHSVTVHTAFDVASPFPKFEPLICMKFDGSVVVNCGSQLHVLSVDLEYVQKSKFVGGVRSSGENLEEPTTSGNVGQGRPAFPGSTVPIRQGESSDRHPWLEKMRSVVKSVCELQGSVSSPKGVLCTKDSLMDISKSDDEDDARSSTSISGSVSEKSSKIDTSQTDSDKQICISELEAAVKHSEKLPLFQTDSDRTGSNPDMDCDEETCSRGKRQVPIKDDRLLENPSQELNISCEPLETGCLLTPAFSTKYDSNLGLSSGSDRLSDINKLDDAGSKSELSSVAVKPLLALSSEELGGDEILRPGQKSSSPSPRPLKRTHCGKLIKISSPVSPTSAPSRDNKMAAEAEKAYEFTEDLPEAACEKLSSFRRRRLADKKYEFCEEGEGSENIVPYQLHRRRVSIRSGSSGPAIPRRRRMESDLSESSSRPGLLSSPSSHANTPSSSYTSIANDGPCRPKNIVIKPLNRKLCTSPSASSSSPEYGHVQKLCSYDLETADTNSPSTSSSTSFITDMYPLSQSAAACVDRDEAMRRGVNQKRPATAVLARKASQRDLVSVSEEASLPVIGDAVVEEAATAESAPSNAGRCTVQIKRRFIEVDDELMSVITDIEDDDLNEFGGVYHCALPLEVHGAGYTQLQMISNTKAEKLMAPCVLVTQKSFDVELFCHIIAERLCKESGKKYWSCSDYDVELIDVCPLSGDVIAFAVMRVQAGRKSKGLSKSERTCGLLRQQYQGGCCFAWCANTGVFSVVYTQPLTELGYVDEKKAWNPARRLADMIRLEMPEFSLKEAVRCITNRPALTGISATMLEDPKNKIVLIL